jgi:hypothetical protein
MTEIQKVLKFKIRILFKIHNSKFSSEGACLPVGRDPLQRRIRLRRKNDNLKWKMKKIY